MAKKTHLMIKNAKWIWLNKRAYPNVQKTTTWFSAEHKQYVCRFAEIEKEFVFDKKIDITYLICDSPNKEKLVNAVKNKNYLAIKVSL